MTRHHLIPAFLAAQVAAQTWTVRHPFLQTVDLWVPITANELPDGNRDGRYDIRDLAYFLNAYGAGSGWCDCDWNGTLDGRDFACYVNAFVAEPRPALVVTAGTVVLESWTGFGLPVLSSPPGWSGDRSPMAYWASIVPEPGEGGEPTVTLEVLQARPIHVTWTRWIPGRIHGQGQMAWAFVEVGG